MNKRITITVGLMVLLSGCTSDIPPVTPLPTVGAEVKMTNYNFGEVRSQEKQDEVIKKWNAKPKLIIEEQELLLLLGGSSSCPPVVESASLKDGRLDIVLKQYPANKICTMDYRVKVHSSEYNKSKISQAFLRNGTSENEIEVTRID